MLLFLDIKKPQPLDFSKDCGAYFYYLALITRLLNDCSNPSRTYCTSTLTDVNGYFSPRGSSIFRLFPQNPPLNKEYKERMGNAMGGVILEMESDKIWDKAGRYADRRRQILNIDNMVKKLNMSLEEACGIQDITVEDYQKAVEFVKEIEEERLAKAGNP